MTKRDTVVKIAEENLGKTLTVDWFNENYPEFFYIPDANPSTKELDYKLIEALLWDYKVNTTKVFVPEGTYRKMAKSIKISKIKEKNEKTGKGGKTCAQKFIELAKPNDKGCSRVVYKDEFNKVEGLSLGNGGKWCRGNSKLVELFKLNVVRDKNGILSVELLGWNRETNFSQYIRRDIVEELKNKPCVFTGSTSHIEVDHKDGRKNDLSLNDIKNQSIDSFQPVCKAMNDFKRQKCKECKMTGKRWKATNIKGNPIDFYKGCEDYKGTCEGCYLKDPVEYRLFLLRK